MFLLFEQAGGGQKFTGPPREKPASGSATPQNTSDFEVKKVGSPFPSLYRLPPSEKAGFGGLALLVVFLDILESSRTRAHKGLWKPGEGPSPRTGGKRDTPSRERPFAAPKTSKNANIKKDSLALYGLPKVCKTTHTKKISLPRYPPTLWRPRETHRGPVGGGISNSGGLIGQGEPLF